jgi:PadR family transcriptional regulator PadR
VALLEPALLVLLKEEPRHGYSLLADLAALGMNTLHPSVVYRTLREMEALGWVESGWDSGQTQGPPRRVYRLAAAGHEALQAWRLELEKARGLIGRLLG